jgi:hypothetical protein
MWEYARHCSNDGSSYIAEREYGFKVHVKYREMKHKFIYSKREK